MVKDSLLLTLQVASHLAYMVVLPLLLFGGGGLLLDRTLQTLPTFLFVGIGTSFAVTVIWIKTRLVRIIKQKSE